MSTQEKSAGIGLADFLSGLHKEFEESQVREIARKAGAIDAGHEPTPSLILQSVDLEIELAVEREHEGKVGIKFWVLSVGGSIKKIQGNTHTVKLKYLPEGKLVAGTDDD